MESSCPEGLGHGCGDTGTTALDQCDPSTAPGFVRWSLLWLLAALGSLIRGRIPRLPSPRRTYLYPCWSGGSDHRWGVSSGGPLVFGGETEAGWRCVAPKRKVRSVIRRDRIVRVVWEPRQPKEYRVKPRRFDTGEYLAGFKE